VGNARGRARLLRVLCAGLTRGCGAPPLSLLQEHAVLAPRAGVVTDLQAAVGSQIGEGEVLLRVAQQAAAVAAAAGA
jgi:hypothetical protein